MRRFWLFTICGLLLAVVIPLLAAYCPRILLPSQCSPLYQRYCHTPGIEASYVKGFRINDTLAIDATLLHATDSASWERLVEDYEVPASLWNDTSSPEDRSITLSLRKKGQTKNVKDSNLLNNDYIAINMPEHLIGIYHITDSAQWYACIDYCLLSIKNTSL